ncbi:thiolase family protein [Polycladomyces subterraneus]|uniref:Thiolase family protein n=1 Tax=Polycladomyces subterraneus TaxID=1016997 RepID=A0ABT8INE6_9BACL|nr:thiolase family protein [Polycladomyces subterraneus]MDN4593654.1 thiolase family protein [Polycladomyces subterraneus]
MREAYLLDAVRTPFGKRDGGLKEIHPVDLLGGLLQGLLRRTQIDPGKVDDVIMGCVDQVGEQGANIARNAWLSAGLPESVPATTVDRQCGSALQAVQFAAQGVMAGQYDLAIAGGVESMSRIPIMSTLGRGMGTPMTEGIRKRYRLEGTWFDQAYGADVIAKQWGLTRDELDRYAYDSHRRASAARARGYFQQEILPVQTHVQVEEDEGIRDNPSLEKMAQLPPAFDHVDLITAGNASQISDGASALLIGSKEAAEAYGLRPLARFVAFAAVGADPVTMLTGPIPATRKVLQRAGLGLEDIDLFEINEAFSSVVLAWQKEIGVPLEKVNVNGGAIALGHPLGATGGRLVGTLAYELRRRNGRYGLIAICEGGGMANAAIIEAI